MAEVGIIRRVVPGLWSVHPSVLEVCSSPGPTSSSVLLLLLFMVYVCPENHAERAEALAVMLRALELF